jgi:hypothetical protein
MTEENLWAMWLMYGRAPHTRTAPGELVDLGEIGSVAEKNWSKATPYSPAEMKVGRSLRKSPTA